MIIDSHAADRDLAGRVRNFLNGRHMTALRRLSVTAHNGTVTVQGKVHSFHEKQVAIHSCRRVAGVLDLIDRVVVAGAEGPQRGRPEALLQRTGENRL